MTRGRVASVFSEMAPVLTVIGATAAVFILSIGMMTFFVVNSIRGDIAELRQDVKNVEIEVSGLKADMEIVKSLLLPLLFPHVKPERDTNE